MSVNLLLQEFKRVARTPEAIARLRYFITDLAVTGRLEEQDLAESPPEEVTRLARQTDAPSWLPINWVSGNLEDLIEIRYGKGLPAGQRSEEGPVAVYGSNGAVSRTSVAMTELPAIIVGRKGSAGALVIADGPSWTTDVAYYILPPTYLDIDFLFLQLSALRLSRLSKGVKPGLSRSDMHPLQLAVPPKPEQSRIVGRSRMLFGLCDDLKSAQEEREARGDELRSAVLHHLTGTNESADNEAGIHLFLETSSRLTTRANHVASIRQVILDLGVRGRLVPQDPNDEPAADLLARLRTSEQTSSAARPKSRSEPFDLPMGWQWVRFPQLGAFGRGKSKHRPRNDPALYSGGIYPFIQTGDVARSGGQIRTFSGMYNDKGLAQSQMWPAGTLCITIAANIADSGILTFDACFPDSVVGLTVSEEFPDSRYFEYFLRTAKTDLHFFAPSTAQKNINLAILNEVLIPLPPLNELQRIVAKVDELMAVCDELEAALDSAQHDRQLLLEALLNEALNESDRATDPATAITR